MAAKKRGPTKRGKDVQRAAEEAMDPDLVRALCHPWRVQILSLLIELKKYGRIELTRTEPRRGAVEHFYRATERVLVPEGLAAALPKSARMETLNRILQLAEKDMKESLEAGTFYDRPDVHASWSPFQLDETGRQRIHDDLDAVLKRAIAEEEAPRR